MAVLSILYVVLVLHNWNLELPILKNNNNNLT